MVQRCHDFQELLVSQSSEDEDIGDEERAIKAFTVVRCMSQSFRFSLQP